MNKKWYIFEDGVRIIYPRGSGRYPAMIVFDEFEYDSEMEYFCRWMLKKQLERPLNYLEVKNGLNENGKGMACR